MQGSKPTQFFQVTDDLFHVIEDALVILRSKGTFYQKKVYRRGTRLYAAWGSGFIRIGGGDATSHPSVSVEALDLPFAPAAGPLGAPLVPARAEGIAQDERFVAAA